MQENFTILNQGPALERPTIPIKLLLFQVPEPCRAAILDCRVIHWILWVLQETLLNDHLLKKDYPPRYWTIQRMWHHPLRDCRPDVTERSEAREMKRESLNTSILITLTSKEEVECWIILVELILTVVCLIRITREFLLRNGISWLYGISKVGKSTSQLRFVHEQPIFRSPCSGIKEVETSSNQLTNLRHLDRLQGSTNFLISICLMRWLRQPWRSFSTRRSNFLKRVSVEEQRAQKDDRFLRGRQIPYIIYEYFRATGGSWTSTRTLNSVQYTLTQWRCSRFRRQMRSCFIICEWNALRYDPGWIVQVKITEFCSISDFDGTVRSRNCANQGAELSTIEDSCKHFILITLWELETSESGTTLWKAD